MIKFNSLIALIISLILSSNLKAQITKGAISIGLDCGLGFQNKKISKDEFNSIQVTITKYKKTDFLLAPTIRYFVRNNVSIGASLGYNWKGSSIITVEKNGSFNDPIFPETSPSAFYSRSNGIGLTFLADYYIRLADNMYFVLGVNPGISSLVVKSHTNQVTYNSEGEILDMELYSSERMSAFTYSVGIQPSFMFFPAEKWALQFNIGNLVKLTHTSFKGNSYNTNEFQILGINTAGVGLSLHYFLR